MNLTFARVFTPIAHMLARTLALLIIASNLIVMTALLRETSVLAWLYFLGDNLTLLSAAVAVLLALLPWETQPEAPALTRLQLGLWLGVGLIAAVAFWGAMNLWIENINLLHQLGAVGVGVAMILTLFSLLSPEPTVQPISLSQGWTWWVIGGLYSVCAVLRIFAPTSPLLFWAIAPLTAIIPPGLSLAYALMPDNTRLERLLMAMPLSIGIQVISLTWLNLLGVHMSVAGIWLVSILWTLIGAGAVYGGSWLHWVRERRR